EVSVMHVPPKAALMTRCTTTTSHTPVPLIVAVQGISPRSMFTAHCTSTALTFRSPLRSQLFKLLLLEAALKEAVLAQYRPESESHCAAYVPIDDVRRCAQPFPFSVASFMKRLPE